MRKLRCKKVKYLIGGLPAREREGTESNTTSLPPESLFFVFFTIPGQKYLVIYYEATEIKKYSEADFVAF